MTPVTTRGAAGAPPRGTTAAATRYVTKQARRRLCDSIVGLWPLVYRDGAPVRPPPVFCDDPDATWFLVVLGGSWWFLVQVQGDATTLYLCEGGSPAGAKKCSSGKCVVASSGSDDYCS
jgi:hypothetical protein